MKKIKLIVLFAAFQISITACNDVKQIEVLPESSKMSAKRSNYTGFYSLLGSDTIFHYEDNKVHNEIISHFENDLLTENCVSINPFLTKLDSVFELYNPTYSADEDRPFSDCNDFKSVLYIIADTNGAILQEGLNNLRATLKDYLDTLKEGNYISTDEYNLMVSFNNEFFVDSIGYDDINYDYYVDQWREAAKSTNYPGIFTGTVLGIAINSKEYHEINYPNTPIIIGLLAGDVAGAYVGGVRYLIAHAEAGTGSGYGLGGNMLRTAASSSTFGVSDIIGDLTGWW